MLTLPALSKLCLWIKQATILETIIPPNPKEPMRWWASELMVKLDYRSKGAFDHLIRDAVRLMILLDIPYEDNVFHIDTPNRIAKHDTQLTRFACYLVAMLADRRKRVVSETQRKLIARAKRFDFDLENVLHLERHEMREEIGVAGKVLNRAAASKGVKNFSAFTEAGYRGLYGMDSHQLATHRGLPEDESILNNIGRTELALNLLRETITEERIRQGNLTGQMNLQNAHQQTGHHLRHVLRDCTGLFPEELPLEEELADIKKHIREGYEKMRLADLAAQN